MTIRIVTDSVADLPSDVVKELGITVIPLVVRWGEELYRDGIDLTAGQFYEKLRQSKTLPVTSVPSPGAFAEAYDKLAEETNEILAIIVSAKLSGTYDVALHSIGLMKKNCRVEVIDSQSATMAEGFIVMEAARAAQAGATLGHVIEITRKTIPRVDFLSTFDTLEYLRRGGRIGKAQAFLGSLLKVNPVLGIKDGATFPIARSRSRTQAMDLLVNFVRGFSQIEAVAIEDATTPDDLEALAGRLKDVVPPERIHRSNVSPVVGTHVGPHVLAVAVLEEE